ncbi:MAG: shikimate kinase [Eubacteriales bacterium]|nr:shikimate kinase [Eubacteriales bacterium]
MDNIILIGFMGAGKSTIGRKLARDGRFVFVDTDDKIEEEQQEKISHIFETKGEAYFRDLETQALKDLLSCKMRMVIAVGGGLPMREENRRLLKELGTVIYLKAEIDTLVSRLTGDTSRPKLRGGSLREKIETLMQQREAIYLETADEEIFTDEKEPEKIAKEIKERFFPDL